MNTRNLPPPGTPLTVSIFIVFLSIFLISPYLQLKLPKLCLNTGTANAQIAVILFLACNSQFSTILNLLVIQVGGVDAAGQVLGHQ